MKDHLIAFLFLVVVATIFSVVVWLTLVTDGAFLVGAAIVGVLAIIYSVILEAVRDTRRDHRRDKIRTPQTRRQYNSGGPI